MMPAMLYLKFLLSALVIVGASELAKRNLAMGALLCALPLTSLMVLSWTWVETADTARISALSISILAYTIPSLVLFVALPLLLRTGAGFWLSLVGASAVTFLVYKACEPLIGRWTA